MRACVLCVCVAEHWLFEASHPTLDVTKYALYRRARRHLVTISGARLPDVRSLDPDDVRSATLSPDARQELHAKREKYALSVLVMFSPFRHPDLTNDRHSVPDAPAAAPAPALVPAFASAASAAVAHPPAPAAASAPAVAAELPVPLPVPPAAAAVAAASPASTSYWSLYLARIATIRQCPTARRVLDHIQDFYDDAHDHTDSHPIEPSALELQMVCA